MEHLCFVIIGRQWMNNSKVSMAPVNAQTKQQFANSLPLFFFVPVLQIVPSLRRWNLSLIAHYYFNTVKHDLMKALLKFFTVLLKLQKL